jgi:ATP-dependent DNA helicase Rep
VQEDTIEEERRLAYVGITRAQKFLQLSWCQTRARGGQDLTRHMSRFLLELQQREAPADWVAAGAEPKPKSKSKKKGRRRRARR